MRVQSLLAAMLGLGSSLAACSVINAYDEVIGATSNGGGGAGKGGAGGSSDSGGSGGSSGSSGGEAGEGGGMAGEGGDGTGGGGPPTTGLIVVGGTVADSNEQVLVTLDPQNGEELARETISGAAVAGIAYDGAEGKNLWFVFTATSYPADPLSRADLRVRRYDDRGASWSTINEVTALPPPQPDSFVVLNDRLAYVSTIVEDSNPVDSVTILDTADPSAISEVQFTLPALSGEVLGMVGVRGSPGNPQALGGTLAVAVGEGCRNSGVDRTCSALTLLPIFVGNAVTTGVSSSQRAFSGVPAFASAVLEQRAFVALPAASPTGNVEVLRFNPRDLTFETALSPTTEEHWVGGLAYADCTEVMAFSAVTTGMTWATSQQGLSTSLPLPHAGQGIVYEPFTGSVLTPFNPDNEIYQEAQGLGGAGNDGPALHSFSVAQASITPSLNERDSSAWDPPADIAPNLVAVRFPIPFSCP